MSKIVIFNILFCFSIKLIAQNTIYGSIKDKQLTPLSNTTISIKKNKKDQNILAYGISDKSGDYRIDFEIRLDTIFIEYKHFSFRTKSIEINNYNSQNQPYLIDVVLEKDTTSLDEVFVTSKKRPIEIKKDTLIYDVDSFADGTEKAVEDLLKKLPGLQVNDNGQISFKGNPISNVLLDGEDLFNANYTIGTKNISADMVGSVEAIENYIKNPLLYGIEQSKKTVLNLTIKKGKTDFSNNSNIGAGVKNRKEIKTNLLGISKKIKSFSTVNYNNIGKEFSPYDYFSSNNLSLESINELEYSLEKIIDEEALNSPLPAERSRINDNVFASINTIYKINRKFGVKLNADFLKDNLERTILSQTLYNTDAQNTVEQSSIILKKPQLLNFNVHLNHKLSPKAIIEYEGGLKNEQIGTTNQILINDIDQISTLYSKEIKTNHILNYTRKTDKNKAFVSKIVYYKNNLPQRLNILPDFRIEQNNEEPQSSIQKVNLTKTFFSLRNDFLKNKNNRLTKIATGYKFENNIFKSTLFINNPNDDIANDLVYKNQYLWTNFQTSIKSANWVFEPSLEFKLLDQKLTNNLTKSAIDNVALIINPKIALDYYLNKKTSFGFTASYDEKAIELRNIYSDRIFTTNQIAINNKFELETLKFYSSNISYNYSDFFNLFLFNVNLFYLRQLNTFSSKISISDLVIESTNILQNADFENFSLNFNFDNYVNFLKSNLRINITQSLSKYNNILNDSRLRSNVGYAGLYEANLKTGFLGKINFENNLQLRNTSFKVNRGSTSNLSIINSFKIYLKPANRLRFSTGVDFYMPSSEVNNKYFFIDSKISFESKNKRLSYTLSSKNVSTNDDFFGERTISDYSSTFKTYSLQGQYILFSVDFKL